MSETPNPHPDGGNDKPKTWLNLIPRTIDGTRHRIAKIFTPGVIAGAAIGTLAMPGYGTIIGAAMGNSMIKMMEPKKGGHDDHGGH